MTSCLWQGGEGAGPDDLMRSLPTPNVYEIYTIYELHQFFMVTLEQLTHMSFYLVVPVHTLIRRVSCYVENARVIITIYIDLDYTILIMNDHLTFQIIF